MREQTHFLQVKKIASIHHVVHFSQFIVDRNILLTKDVGAVIHSEGSTSHPSSRRTPNLASRATLMKNVRVSESLYIMKVYSTSLR